MKVNGFVKCRASWHDHDVDPVDYRLNHPVICAHYSLKPSCILILQGSECLSLLYSLKFST